MRRKSIPFQQVNLLPMVQVAAGPLLYGGNTVPGMRIDGERLVGSRTIMRRLDLLAPEPPLLPADPAERERVLEAERWGDDVFQSVPRRILDAGFLRNAGGDGELRGRRQAAAASGDAAPRAAAHGETDGTAQPRRW